MGGAVRGSVAAGVAVACTLAILIVVEPWRADAGHLPAVDPRDADGRLDIRRVDVFGSDRPRWKIVTYERWRARDVWDTGYVLVWLDTFGNGRFDYFALVRSTGSDMKAELFRDRRKKRDVMLSSLRVWRRNRRNVAVRVPFANLFIGSKRIEYRWSAQTLFMGPNCRRTCFDFTPDTGAVSELLPGVVPTPTETPTSEPTATTTPTAGA